MTDTELDELSRVLRVHALEDSTVTPEVPLSAIDWLPNIFADVDFRACIEACDKIMAKKGVDYTGGSVNRLMNFDEAAAFLGVKPLQVLAVYLFKHMAAFFSYCKRGQVESEAIYGRICDAVNYLLLAFKLIKRGG